MRVVRTLTRANSAKTKKPLSNTKTKASSNCNPVVKSIVAETVRGSAQTDNASGSMLSPRGNEATTLTRLTFFWLADRLPPRTKNPPTLNGQGHS